LEASNDLEYLIEHLLFTVAMDTASNEAADICLSLSTGLCWMLCLWHVHSRSQNRVCCCFQCTIILTVTVCVNSNCAMTEIKAENDVLYSGTILE
jgi:hypothetical protein